MHRYARFYYRKCVRLDIGTTQNNVSRWELGLTTPGPYFRAKLCTLFGKSTEELGFIPDDVPSFSSTQTIGAQSVESPSQTFVPADDLALWTVPYLRNPHFTGREELLEQLTRRLSPKAHNELLTIRQVALTQAIKRLGGIGKTQIAVEYAYRAHEQGRYTHTLWINAACEEALLTSFGSLADLLPTFPAKSETNQRKLVEAMKRWLEQCQQPWLLIFDNADDLSLVQPYFPKRGNGSLLLTTRANAVGSFAASLDVENMGLIEGTTFLIQRAQRQQASDEEHNEATNIVIALDGFPLSLDQAGAYIEETGCHFHDYRQLYQDHRKTLVARRGTQATNYLDSVATTCAFA